MSRKTFGGQCGECTSCGKCERMLNRQAERSRVVASQSTQLTSPALPQNNKIVQQQPMEQDTTTKLYTFLIYSENVPGLLSQITAVFTRRQVNIESLNVCASSTPGAHKYTVTAYCDEHMAQMLTANIEKRIEVMQANYYTDDEIYINETALFKISTCAMLKNRHISRVVRLHDSKIVEVNSTYAVVEKTGTTEEIISLYEELSKLDCILQFVRSGRICITKSRMEHLSEFLAAREEKRNKNLNSEK